MMLYFLGTLERVMRNLQEEMEAKMTSKDVQHKPEARSNMNSSLPRPPGPACSKTDVQVAYELRFWWSTYGWKDNFIRKPMEVFSHQNSIRINGNHWNKLTSRICQGAASPCFGPFGPCNVSDSLETWIKVLGRPLGYIISSSRLR